MKKRSFLKLVASLFGAATTFRLFAQDASVGSTERLTNWSGNLAYSTDNVFGAESVDDVQRFLKEQTKLRVLGTRHCFNNIADSAHQLVSVQSMNQPVTLDREKRSVTLQAGMSYGQLSPWLEQQGFALHNLASLPHISVAGACATGTHGSGVDNGNLSTAVSAMEIVKANGDVVTLSREKDGDVFSGAVIHLGLLGVATKITLDIEKNYRARQYVYQHLPLSEAYEHFDEIMSSGYSVSFFTGWEEMDELWIKVREDQTFDSPRSYFGGKLATKNLHPIADLPSENCTDQLGVLGTWYERLPHFKMGFTPSSGKELQSEYFVDLKNAVDALKSVARLRDHIRPHLFISELRTIAADQLWMSPHYKRPSLAIHFTWKQNWNAVSKVLPMIERELAPYEVRPHWGKLFTIPPTVLQSRYEKLNDFKDLIAEYDPAQKFRNAFIDKHLYG